MFKIAKHVIGAALSVHSTPLSTLDAADLKRWWTGSLPKYREVAVLGILSDLKRRGQWLGCTCTNMRNKPPLLSPRKTPSGGISLSRMFDRAPHASNCVFSFDQRSESTVTQDPKEHHTPDAPTNPPDFLDSFGQTGLGGSPNKAPKGKSDGEGKNGTRENRLSSQLYWLLENSGQSTWPGHATHKEQRLAELAATIKLKNGVDLTAEDILFWDARAWTDPGRWMDGSFKKCEIAGLDAQAILICPVTQASRADSWVKFTEAGAEIPVEGQISIFGTDAALARYPMLMYAKIHRKPGYEPEISKAYLHPVLATDNWMLVESNYERQAMDTLVESCEILAKSGIHCRIEKPIYPWRGTGARPDFVLHATKNGICRILIIETMGTDDPKYVAQKIVTKSKLYGYSIFEDKRYSKDGLVDTRMLRFVLGHMRGQFSTD